jgi:hypothetical protein
MDNVRIASTPTSGLRPLGSSGQRAHALLVGTLERHLGRAHAELFAEPVMAPDGATIDWYAALDGDPVPMPAASGRLREEAQARLERLTQDIVGLAGRLEASASEEDRQRAEALRRALQYPDESFIHVVDGRPVLTGWAYAHEDSTRPVGNLTAWLTRPAPPDPGPTPSAATAAETTRSAGDGSPAVARTLAAPAARRPFPWLQLLLWLLLAVLLTLLFVQLVRPCGVGFPGRAWAEEVGLVDRCPGAATVADGSDAALAAAAEREAQLRGDIRRLLREIAFDDNACRQEQAVRPTRPASPAPASPAPAAPGAPDDAAGPSAPAPDRRAAPAATPPSPAAPRLTPNDRAAAPTAPEAERDDFRDRLAQTGGGDGALTVSLKWDDPSDLDLTVLCPGDQRLSGASPRACGGVHEVDANAADDPDARPRPVEHAVWSQAPAAGAYEVLVTLYAYRETPPGTEIPFQVRVAGGKLDDVVSASVAGAGASVNVLQITVP